MRGCGALRGAGGGLGRCAQAHAPNGDIPAKFVKPDANNDYVKRVEMIPMRDGVKLYTVIVIPKGAKDAPIVMTRTPYNAKMRAQRNDSASMLALLPLADELYVKAGYIRVYQDVRGKYGSEGAYVMTRPPRGPLNASKTDDTTDAWDTIDWLVKTIKQSNGRVGMIGSSYEGWTVVMALLDPHPALKAAVPESPMVDGWMGDDWYHYGAYRTGNLDFTAGQTEQKGEGTGLPRTAYDDYEFFLNGGSGRHRQGGRLRPAALVEEDGRPPVLRRLLAGPGPRQAGRRPPLQRSHLVGTRFVGPGGHVGRQPFLAGPEGGGPRGQQLARDGSLVPQPGESRGLGAGALQMGPATQRCSSAATW